MAEVDTERRHAGPVSPERRRFLTNVSVVLTLAIGALVGLPVIGYLLLPLVRQPEPRWVDVGEVDEFPEGEAVLVAYEDPSPLPWAGLTALTSVYVRRIGPQEFVVFSVHCTHLGCPVNWLQSARIFVCPCHGGVFYQDGSPAAGPPQHKLYEFTTRIVDGRLQVQTRPLPPRPEELAHARRRTRL